MAENKEKYITHHEERGNIMIAEDVVTAIALDAAMEIEGVSGMMASNMTEQLMGKKAARGIRMEVEGEEMTLDMFLMIRYGYDIPEVASKVQEAVGNAVASMTGFAVRGVNVHVGGIDF